METFKIGDRVIHKSLGKGYIIELKGLGRVIGTKAYFVQFDFHWNPQLIRTTDLKKA